MTQNQTEDMLDRGMDWADSARRGEVSPAILAVVAVLLVAVLWVALKVARFVMKIASVLAMLSAVAGVLMYLFNRDRENELGEDE